MSRVLALVSFRVYPTHMGGQKGVALFYQYLKEYLSITVAASTDNVENGKTEFLRVLCPNKRIYLNVFKLKQLKALIRSQSINVIIAEHSYSGWIAWLLHKLTGKPFIIHSHNIESDRFLQMHKWWWRAYYRYEGWIHRKANHNFFISEDDKKEAISQFHLKESKCSVITYGVKEISAIKKHKSEVKKTLGLQENGLILLFNGTMDYKPNYDAVICLVDKIEPILRQKLSNYQIIITGNRAPEELIRKIQTNNNIQYLGYVKDVDQYYQCADLFLNPIINDSGVKTKVIEAIANNCTVISTKSGATGIMKELCSNKIITVKDNDWDLFANKVVDQINMPSVETSLAFYQYYNWKKIASKAAHIIEEVSQTHLKSR
jgi:glycosyltransferase involved in cell wall biosynthesis